mmetsp:Transcript_49672/g.160618  ORF Transcript_49672/g.160618 Transcript_49672/m.160618 type:complete len:217 (-) Transcript_49672:34-684(-)
MGAGVGDLDLGVLLRLLALLQQNLCRSGLPAFVCLDLRRLLVPPSDHQVDRGKHDRLLHILGLGCTPTCNLVLRPRLRHVVGDLVLSGEALRDHNRMVGAEEGRCPDSQCQAAGGTAGADSDRIVRLRMRGTTSGSELHLKVVTACPCTLTRLRFSDQGQMSEISVAARLSSKGFLTVASGWRAACCLHWCAHSASVMVHAFVIGHSFDRRIVGLC